MALTTMIDGRAVNFNEKKTFFAARCLVNLRNVTQAEREMHSRQSPAGISFPEKAAQKKSRTRQSRQQ